MGTKSWDLVPIRLKNRVSIDKLKKKTKKKRSGASFPNYLGIMLWGLSFVIYIYIYIYIYNVIIKYYSMVYVIKYLCVWKECERNVSMIKVLRYLFHESMDRIGVYRCIYLYHSVIYL